jgi:hypothetical protein
MLFNKPSKVVFRRSAEGLSDNIRIRLTAAERAIVGSIQDKIAAQRSDGRRPTISLVVAEIIKAVRVDEVASERSSSGASRAYATSTGSDVATGRGNGPLKS